MCILLDTGAFISLIRLPTWDQFGKKEYLKSTKLHLKSFTGNDIPEKGQIKVPVHLGIMKQSFSSRKFTNIFWSILAKTPKITMARYF